MVSETVKFKANRFLPFSVDRERSTSLTAQIVDGVRQAVQTGVYKPGDLFPGFREIAKELGVCLTGFRCR